MTITTVTVISFTPVNEGEEVELEMPEGEKDIGVLVDRNLSFNMKNVYEEENPILKNRKEVRN
jgi:hypothetical protein